MRDFDKDFENWYEERNYPHVLPKFSLLQMEIRFGVYQDFFDEKGIVISISKRKGLYWDSVIRMQNQDGDFQGVHSETHKTRQEARQSCFKTAKDIYNGK